MIFFNLFTERWMSATNGLDLLHRGAYIALMVHQYANEVMALPHDLDECYRIAGAHTLAERRAVTVILRDFYEKKDVGYEQKKIVAEVSKFQAKEPERVIHRERDAARKAASRATQKALFALGRQHGLPVIGGMSIADLRAMLLKAGVALGPLAATEWPERFTHMPLKDGINGVGVTEPVTVTVTEQVTEISTNHDPLTTVTLTSHTPRAPATVTPQMAGEACKAMRTSGMVGVNPSHPDLIALLAAGCTVDHLAMCAATAAAKGAPFAYALAIAKGQMLAGERTAKALAERKPKAESVMAILAPSVVSRQ